MNSAIFYIQAEKDMETNVKYCTYYWDANEQKKKLIEKVAIIEQCVTIKKSTKYIYFLAIYNKNIAQNIVLII